jgi:NADP-dependent 3-hydroxy acid dehydrogenase YdfG
VRDREALAAALDRAGLDLGPVEVLQYSAVPRKEFLRPVLETTVDEFSAATELSILGAAAVVERVLPGRRELGRGTVILVNGSSAAKPRAPRPRSPANRPTDRCCTTRLRRRAFTLPDDHSR